MNFGNIKTLWYSAGLQFECLQCGRCCAGPEQGYIWLSRHEARLIANHLNISVKELKQKYLKSVGFRLSIAEDPHTQDCVFLRQTQQGRGCAIYEVRPAQCRSWPFWPGNLASRETWDYTGTKCPGINKGPLHSVEEIEIKKKNKRCSALPPKGVPSGSSPTVAKDGTKNDQIIARVSEIYKWIEGELLANKAIAGKCLACGKCCDFESYGHKLFVTTPEMIYFVEKIGKINVIASGAKQSQALEIEKLPRRPDSSGLLAMTTGRCPYQVEGKCSVHAHRFSGCRIFCCKGKAMFQSELTEAVIKKFKSLCAELQIPYRYVELSEFLTAGNAKNF